METKTETYVALILENGKVMDAAPFSTPDDASAWARERLAPGADFVVYQCFYDVEQMNELYDPAMSHDGGGYDQPCWNIYVFAKNMRITVCDSSCGDFGTRYWAQVENGPEATWGSMWDEPLRQSTFSENDDVAAGIIYAITGISVPWDYEMEKE